MTGLEVMGATASALQIAGMICSFGRRILDKPKDTKALRDICADAKKYITYLMQWEEETTFEAKDACTDLRQRLQEIVDDVDGLKGRKRLAKVITCLKLYKPEFRDTFIDALNEFTFRMCFQSRRSVEEMNGKLEGMTKKMEELQITSRTLLEIPDMKDAVSKVQENIDKLSNEIHKTTMTITKVHSIFNELRALSPIIPQVLEAITTDGNITRERINQSTDKVVRHLDMVTEHLDLSESVVRIKAEILPKTSPLIWYEGENKPSFRLWSLDDSSEKARPDPNAFFGGVELSSVRLSDTYDNIVTQRHLAEDVDEDIRERKCQRVSDISPFVGLAKRENHLEELHEYMPLTIGEIFPDDVPQECQIEASRIARALSQEYRYIILDQILKRKAYTLPKLRLLEDMERAMLALHAEKMSVNFGFFLERTVDNVDLPYELRIHITSVGYDVSLEDYPFEQQLNYADRLNYDTGKRQIPHTIMQQLHSLGREGLCELLRMSLAILSNDHHNESRHFPISAASKGIQTIFEALFREEATGTRKIEVDPFDLYGNRTSFLSTSVGKGNWDFTRAGNLLWHECTLTTSSSKLHYEGPDLFGNRWLSAAHSFIASGNFEEARKILRQGIAKETVSPSEDLWVTLGVIYMEEGDFNQAIETFNLALSKYPGCFAHDSELWSSWRMAYRFNEDPEAGVNRFKLAIERKEGDCWESLSGCYEDNGDHVNAIKVLEAATDLRPDLSAHYLKIMGVLYQKHENHEEASKAYRMAVLKDQENGAIWELLSKTYEKCGRSEESIEALENGIQNVTLDDIHRLSLISRFSEACDAKGYHERAIGLLQREKDKTTEKPALWRMLGKAYTAAGDHKQAIDCFETAIEKGCREVSRVLLGNLYRLNGNSEKAIEIYKEAAEQNPYDEKYVVLLEEMLVEESDIADQHGTVNDENGNC